MKTPYGSPVSSPSPKPRQPRNREPGSRFLPDPPNSAAHSAECHSPVRRKSSSPSRRHVTTEDPVPTRHHQLWPSSATKRNSGTLADHITEDRVIDRTSSARHVARFAAPAESPSSSSSNNKKPISSIVPGRLSLEDEKAKSFCDAKSRKADVEAQPDATTASSRFRRARRGTSDSNVANLNSDSSSVLKRFTLKTAITRANSLAGGYKTSSKSSWALSPGRAETMDKPTSFSSFKQPTTTPTITKVKRVDKLLNMGFDLFKTKKSGVYGSLSPTLAFGLHPDLVHRLRLLDNRFFQWRFANARAQAANLNISHKAESKLICVWDGLTKLQHSVLKKKIQFVREKLKTKISFVLYSQIKLLESWGGMERQHSQAITAIKECLHSVVCRVPLLEGARVNMQSTSVALRHATDLTASIKSILTTFSSSEVHKIAAILSELAKVVAQEKQLLQEFYDIFQTICVFEVQERSVTCNLVQLEGWRQKYQQQQLLPEITS